ncbi:MAG: sugar ABC transporter substrate-binding protein [Gaiellaceae bacterium MAG52_C11]|nr:sugar ABC transporter substrate-binding protein [Candidatus Gaiellasilicea maunaloa]
MRRLLLLALVVAGLASVAGCGGSTSGEDGSGPVRFLVFGDPEEIGAYRELVSAYREEVPDAEVELIEAGDRSDLIARLSTSIAGGSPPDLFLMNYRYYGQFASKGAIEPVAGRLEDSSAFSAGDFYPEAMEAFRWKGEQLCLPQNISSLVVYYNRTLFRRQGVPEPKNDWSWSDLVATATRLTLDANGNSIRAGDPDSGGAKAAIYGLGVEPTLIRIAPFVWSIGGELVDDLENPTRLTLDSPAAQVVLAEFFALRRGYGVAPSDLEVEAEEDEARFANGRLAMLLSSRRSTPGFRTITEFEWDVAPLPPFRERAGILHSDAYCMTAASDRKDAAWAFVEFALGPEGQQIVSRTGRIVPSLIEVSRSNAFLDPSQPPRRSQVFLDAIPTIRRVPTISTWPEIEDAAEGVLENGFYLGQPTLEVARELDRVTRPLFARGESG